MSVVIVLAIPPLVWTIPVLALTVTLEAEKRVAEVVAVSKFMYTLPETALTPKSFRVEKVVAFDDTILIPFWAYTFRSVAAESSVIVTFESALERIRFDAAAKVASAPEIMSTDPEATSPTLTAVVWMLPTAERTMSLDEVRRKLLLVYMVMFWVVASIRMYTFELFADMRRPPLSAVTYIFEDA